MGVGRLRSALLSLLALFGIVLLCLPACSTLMSVGTGEKYLLGGTRKNIEAFESGPPPVRYFRFYPPPECAFLDFPFSLALDLVLSPLTLPLQLIHGDERPFTPLPEEGPPQKPK
jgi:hypothetical protein